MVHERGVAGCHFCRPVGLAHRLADSHPEIAGTLADMALGKMPYFMSVRELNALLEKADGDAAEAEATRASFGEAAEPEGGDTSFNPEAMGEGGSGQHNEAPGTPGKNK